MSSSTEAWVTLATNDSYALGAIVLANSLRRSGTTRKVVLMVTPNSITEPLLSQLSSVFDEVVDVERLDSEDSVRLALLERPELGITFTKLHCWNLVQYTKCVFLDADTMVVQNSDELFDREEFSAAPDAGWPDCFNSGVFVFVPSRQTFEAIMEFASRDGSFDGGDQGLLNSFFSEWATADIKKHLPFLYNMVASATYTYLPAFKKFGSDVKIVHFIGASKPWHATFDEFGQPVPSQSEDRHAIEHLKMWWHLYHADVLPKMLESGASLPSHLPSHLSSSFLPSNVGQETVHMFEEQMHKQAWEDGHPDFRGVSSMDNILKKIDSTIASPDNGSSTPKGGSTFNDEVPATDTIIQEASEKLQQIAPSPDHQAARNAGDQETSKSSLPNAAPSEPAVTAGADHRSEKRQWERGHPDYMGAHSFANILNKLSEIVGEELPAASGVSDPANCETEANSSGGESIFTSPPNPFPLPRPAAVYDAAPAVQPAPSKVSDPSSFDFVLERLRANVPEQSQAKTIAPRSPKLAECCPLCKQNLPDGMSLSQLVTPPWRRFSRPWKMRE